MSLIVDGTVVKLVTGAPGWQEEVVPFHMQERMPDGTLLSEISADRWFYRRWTGQTPLADRSTLAVWEALLEAPGPRVLSGYPVNGETVEAYVLPGSLRRVESVVSGYASLAFVLEEASPAFPSVVPPASSASSDAGGVGAGALGESSVGG